MKRLLIFCLALLVAVPGFSQKLSKEEKAAKAKAAYETAKQCIENRNFVLVPSSYVDADNLFQPNNDNSNFFSCEGPDFYVQGTICGAENNNDCFIAEATEYDMKLDKKGNVKLRIALSGRKLKGVYAFTVRTSGGTADVIFTPPTGSVKKFSGSIVPISQANYNKRSNPI